MTDKNNETSELPVVPETRAIHGIVWVSFLLALISGTVLAILRMCC